MWRRAKSHYQSAHDVSIGRRAINATRATAPICPPHERDPLHVQRNPLCWHGCTASRTGEPGITMVWHFSLPDFLFPRRNPYCYYVQFFCEHTKMPSTLSHHDDSNKASPSPRPSLPGPKPPLMDRDERAFQGGTRSRQTGATTSSTT